MSSESSLSDDSSRIRQFGLYRTIDARTEEFLKLSRKRQIRQGCACAAASTAITVTVVIIVFFVYEFSLNSETNLENTLKSNWLTLMNDTSEDSSFNSKITKGSIDKTTLKLLPLLIKAIKKNVFLEKLLEDHSSSSPSYEKEETADGTVEKNTFTNWFKMPTTKLYAIEYKTSPVVFYKNPTKNIEYYTKIRKIRDYQRVFNYVDKMINEKVNIRSTKPYTLKVEIHTEKSVLKNSLFKNSAHKSKPNAQKYTEIPNKDKKKVEVCCKCLKKLGIILHKIFLSIHKLLPETSNQETLIHACDHKETTSVELTTATNLFDSFSKESTKSSITASSEQVTTDRSYKPRRFSFENDVVTKAYSYLPNNTHSPSKKKTFTKPTIITANNIKNTEVKNIVRVKVLHSNYLNKYKDIIQRKQLLRKPETNVTKIAYEPNYDGLDSDEMKTNKVDLVKIKQNFLNDIKNKFKQTKNYTKASVVSKEINKTESIPRNASTTDANVGDNKMVREKMKPVHTKVNNEIKQYITNTTFKKFKPIIKTARSTNMPKTETKLIKNLLNHNISLNTSIKDINLKPMKSNKIVQTIITTKLPIVPKKINLEIPRTPYFSHINDKKTLYRLIKNDINSFIGKKIMRPQKSKSVMYSLKLENITINQPKESRFSQLDDSNQTIYRLIENEVKNLRSKNITTSIANMTMNKVKQKIVTNSNNKTASMKPNKAIANKAIVDKEENTSSITEDDVEYRAELPDVSRRPEYRIPLEPYITMKHNVTKKDDDYFTWEDLTKDVETWQSTIPDSKPVHLEYHNTNIMKHEEQLEEDYNINSNFYDLNT